MGSSGQFFTQQIDYLGRVQSMWHYVHEMLSMLHKAGNHAYSCWDGEINVATDPMKLPLGSCDRENIYWWQDCIHYFSAWLWYPQC